MLILRSAPPSPFGRKVKIAAFMLGLMDQITIEPTDTLSETDTIRQQNPLGKIPTLVLENGTTLYDSRVIVEYLDHLAGGNKILPAEPTARFTALTQQALGDGLMDAAILQIYEGRFRDKEKHEPRWLNHQQGKVSRALAALEAKPPTGARTIGDITIACALSYLDFRFHGTWRAAHPKLVAWLDHFALEVSAFAKTAPPVA